MWFISRDGKQAGPLTTEQLEIQAKKLKLFGSDLVWKEGMTEWVPANSIAEIKIFFAPEIPPPSPDGNFEGYSRASEFDENDFDNSDAAIPPHLSLKNETDTPRKKNSHHEDEKSYCRNCGKETNPESFACLHCGVNPLNAHDYCQDCGAETNLKAIVCVTCGCKLSGSSSSILSYIRDGGDYITPSTPPRDPLLIALLSGCCITPWIGQIALGQTIKGFVLIAGTVALIFFGYGNFLINFYMPIWIIWLVAAVDAYLIAKKLKEGKQVKQWEFF